MARQVKYGERNNADKAYNARRRYYRAAERNLKKAESESGATAARYRQLAQQNLENALATYGENISSARISKPIQRLSEQLNIGLTTIGAEANLTTKRDKEKLISRSKKFLETALQDEGIRSEEEARALINNETIGRRIIGGLVDVWKKPATYTDENGFERIDNKKILPALFEYFNVDSVAGLLDKVEDVIGEELYAPETKNDDIYQYVKVVIQNYVVDNSLVE